MPQDVQLKTVSETGSSQNKKQHTIECEYICIAVDSSQLMIYYTTTVHRQLCDQFIAARKGKAPWSMKAFVHTVRETKLHDDVSSGVFAHECSDKRPQEQAKQTLTIFKDATEAYMVQDIAESHMQTQ